MSEEHSNAGSTGVPQGARQLDRHKGIGFANDHVVALHVGLIDFPQFRGITDYYRLSFAAIRPPRLQGVPGVELPAVREQMGIDLAMHNGDPRAGLTGVTVESLLAVAHDKLMREDPCEELTDALASIDGALDALRRRAARVSEDVS